MASKSTAVFACVLLFFADAAAASGGSGEPTTCVPTLQRLLSCLSFIEHRTDAIPAPCCVQVNATVAQQPCCLMHVLRGNVARLMGPEFDNRRAMVDVTERCLGDASVLMAITRSCSGKPLPALTPGDPFTTGLQPPSVSSSGRLEGSFYGILFLALVARFLCRV